MEVSWLAPDPSPRQQSHRTVNAPQRCDPTAKSLRWRRHSCDDIITLMPNPTDYARVRQRVSEIVASPFAKGLVRTYFDPGRGFAGALFDGLDTDGLLANNPSDRFTADDIAAASLLDVRFGPTAVHALLGSDVIQQALAAVPDQRPLWEATAQDLEAGSRLWRLVRDIEGVGRTRASKLLARKRPHLVPIVDSVIANALRLGDDTWRPLAAVLADRPLRHDIDALRPPEVSTSISTLRLLDVLAWMSHSRSKAAVSAQIDLGAPPTRSIPGLRIT